MRIKERPKMTENQSSRFSRKKFDIGITPNTQKTIKNENIDKNTESIDTNIRNVVKCRYELDLNEDGVIIKDNNDPLFDKTDRIPYDDKRIRNLKIPLFSIVKLIKEGNITRHIINLSELEFCSDSEQVYCPSMTNKTLNSDNKNTHVIHEVSDDSNNRIHGNDDKENIFIIDNTEYKRVHARDIFITVAQWLVDKKIIKRDMMPIGYGRKQFLFNSEPIHANGTPFHTYKKLADGIFLHKNYSAPDCERHARSLMNQFVPDVKFEIKSTSFME